MTQRVPERYAADVLQMDPRAREVSGVIKVITLLTRKPGMSREAFIEYYESNHRLIGEKYLGGYAVKYQRRYLAPVEADVLNSEDVPFDVLMEIWFPDRATMDKAMALLSTEEAQEEIVADEERVFDRALIRSYIVEEYESDMTTG